jgi:hypothetical protein
MIPCKNWIEPCEAARRIEDHFGVQDALAYLRQPPGEEGFTKVPLATYVGDLLNGGMGITPTRNVSASGQIFFARALA